MKLNEKLTELNYTFDEGLWIAEFSDYKVYVNETEDGFQICKMPSDPEVPTLLIRFNRFDTSIFAVLESWNDNA
jgi:hypothetical protein